MTFTLPELPYEYNDLEPYIDAKTMELHHTKHHQTYIDKLNTAVKGTDLENKEIEDILKDINNVPEKIRMAVINHGGGHANHSLFWQLMTSEKQEPSEELIGEIENAFGSFDEFKEKFTNTALSRFGSGWAWLILNSEGELEINSTPNQDSPLMDENIPVLGLDVWEHAYYLKYQNKRPDYISAFFNIINWQKVEELLEEAK